MEHKFKLLTPYVHGHLPTNDHSNHRIYLIAAISAQWRLWQYFVVAIANHTLQMHGGEPGIHPNLALLTLSTKVISWSLILAPYLGYYNDYGHRAGAAEPAFAHSLWCQPGPWRDPFRIQKKGCDTNSLQRSIMAFVRNGNSPGIEEV